MSTNQTAITRVSSLSLAVAAALTLCLVLFPEAALAVCPAPGSEAEASGMECPSYTDELVTFDSINASHPAPAPDPASPTLDAQSETPGGSQPQAPVDVQSEGTGDAQSQVPESDQGETSAKKTMPLLVVVVGFEGTPYRDDFDWGETIFEDDESLAAYYEDMSLGQFTFGPMNETCRLTLGWISYIELEKEGDTILVTAQDYSAAPKDSG